MQLFGRFTRLLLLALGGLSLGCQTVREPLPASGPGWRVQEGQALWRPRVRLPELGGELVMASHADGNCVIEFAKAPLPLLVAQTTRTNWFIEFPAQRRRFAGRGALSARFAWLYLRAALAGEPLPKGYRFDRRAEGRWRLENTRSGEALEGFLAP
jgi:hypothetical protein